MLHSLESEVSCTVWISIAWWYCTPPHLLSVINRQTDRHYNKLSISHNSGLQFQPFALNSHGTKLLHFLKHFPYFQVSWRAVFYTPVRSTVRLVASVNRRVGIQDHIYSGIVPELKTCFKVAQMSWTSTCFLRYVEIVRQKNLTIFKLK
jgi:hypothetical protein